MNITILGADSVLGVEVSRFMRNLQQYRVKAFESSELDLGNPQAVRECLRKQDAVLNFYEYSGIDQSERNRKDCYKANIDEFRNLSYQAVRMKVRMIHFSSAYVFDGSRDGKYAEKDIPNPINIYGSSKFIAEKELRAEGGDYLIVRTNAVYSRPRQMGHFLHDLCQGIQSGRNAQRVIDNQLVGPTFAPHVAEAIPAILELKRNGIMHVGPDDGCTWYEFAQAALAFMREDPLCIQPSGWEQMGLDAARPPNLLLDNQWFKKWTGHNLPSWRVGLEEALS